jgi:hypothetical protein
MRDFNGDKIPLETLVGGGLFAAKVTGNTNLSWTSVILIPFFIAVTKFIVACIIIVGVTYYSGYKAGGAVLENLQIPRHYLKKNHNQTFIDYVFNQPPKSSYDPNRKDNKMYMDDGSIYIQDGKNGMIYLGRD